MRARLQTLSGIVHDTVEADGTTPLSAGMENHTKYRVGRESGFLSQTIYGIKSNSLEGTTTQLIEAAPRLTMPTPKWGAGLLPGPIDLGGDRPMTAPEPDGTGSLAEAMP